MKLIPISNLIYSFVIFKTSLWEVFNRLNKVKELIVGFTKNYRSVFINIVMNGVIDDNMTEQDFMDLLNSCQNGDASFYKSSFHKNIISQKVNFTKNL